MRYVQHLPSSFHGLSTTSVSDELLNRTIKTYEKDNPTYEFHSIGVMGLIFKEREETT